MTDFRDIPGNTNIRRQIEISGSNFRNGVTSPSANLRGSTPAVPVITFANINELAGTNFTLPPEYDGGDINIDFVWALESVQLNGDTLDLTLDYISSAEGDNISKTSTQVTGQITAVTGDLAIGDLYKMRIALDAGDADNPLSAGDVITIEIHLTNTSGVGSADMVEVSIDYGANY